jgi:hypothetical protein
MIDLLSDFFEVKSLSLLRLQALHLQLTLELQTCTLLDPTISILSSLAQQYLRLGYTGKSGTLFAQGLKYMKDAEPSTSTQLLWHINYAEYFSRIGNLPKAKHHISQAGEVYLRISGTPRKRIDASERAERILSVAKAGYVLSLIAFEENELEPAMGYVDYAVRVLKTGITAVTNTTKSVQSKPVDYDPFSTDPRPKPEVTEASGVQFGSKLWGFKSVRTCAISPNPRRSSPCYYDMACFFPSVARPEMQNSGYDKPTNPQRPCDPRTGG